MTLTQLLSAIEHKENGLSVSIPDSWMQGRSTYGGLQAVLAVRAMQSLANELPLRTLQGTLLEPIEGEIDCQVRLLRSSKNTRQIEAQLVKNGQIHATFLGIFGRARESVVNYTRERQIKATKDQMWPYIEGLTPKFLQNLEVSLLHGNFIGSGHQDSEHLFRISLKDDAQASHLLHVLALADFPPPIALSWPKGFKPGSTMTWMLNFTGEPVDGHALSDWQCEVVLDAAQEGYTHQTVSLYAPNGQLILRGTQCMVVFL